jgi:hypothetical protein
MDMNLRPYTSSQATAESSCRIKEQLSDFQDRFCPLELMQSLQDLGFDLPTAHRLATEYQTLIYNSVLALILERCDS